MLELKDLHGHRWLKASSPVIIFVAALWTAVMGISLAWNLQERDDNLLEYALLMARTAFQKDVLYRSWNAEHGGVYVPVNDQTQPNPYLDGYLGQNITTNDGIEYTLVNPAYMTREVFDLQKADNQIFGHITSLNPIRPANAPDGWETRALQSFEQGSNEYFSIEMHNNEQVLRYMSPLITEERCLKCHAKQGYQVGMVRGGISETVRMTPLASAYQSTFQVVIFGHIGIWAFGLAVVIFFGSRLKASLQKQVEAENKLVEMSMFDRLTGVHTRSYFEQILKQITELERGPISFLSADIDDLKKTNDQFGHKAGDLLLQRAAALLNRAFRETDFVARTGGDEFTIILRNTDEIQAQLAVGRVQKVLEQWNAEHPQEPVSISLGIATTHQQNSIQEALKQADQNMYADKARHKNRSSSNPPLA